ncbi:MAG: HesA/MoeB/ThiF family protein [Candidatus Woesearchaeota archaeon]
MDFSCQDKTEALCASAREAVRKTRFVVVGVGALGCAAAQALVRSGAEELVLVDDDSVEVDNLPRQVLFVKEDVGMRKASVAAERLRALDPGLRVSVENERLDADNVSSLLEGAGVVVECTDNLAARRVIDGYCAASSTPWVHAAVAGAKGEAMAVLPGSKGYGDMVEGKVVSEDCANEGVLSVNAIMTGTFEAMLALRVASGQDEGLLGVLFRLDAWSGAVDRFRL